MPAQTRPPMQQDLRPPSRPRPTAKVEVKRTRPTTWETITHVYRGAVRQTAPSTLIWPRVQNEAIRELDRAIDALIPGAAQRLIVGIRRSDNTAVGCDPFEIPEVIELVAGRTRDRQRGEFTVRPFVAPVPTPEDDEDEDDWEDDDEEEWEDDDGAGRVTVYVILISITRHR